MDGDEFFAGEGDLDNASDLVERAGTTVAGLFTDPGDSHLFEDSSTPGHDPDAIAVVVERVLGLLRRVDHTGATAS